MTELIKTREWVERAVIGLNLCPFAKAPQTKGLIRYVLTKTRQSETLLKLLSEQLLYLQATAPQICETVLLVHPHTLTNFLDYNDFLADADQLLERLGLDGVFQIASFHPRYEFADASPNDISNYTNRSPYPMLHILREASIDKALQAYADPDAAADAIVQRNQETLTRLGKDGWARLWQ
ncbi:MAG: DUF1415 domain-containing protein [Cytophagales bacterium]|nr:DUF1415 domain-containing protein [Cytophagales bacterium]